MTARQDVRLAIAKTLPDNPQSPIGGGCDVVIQVRLRSFAQPLDPGPLAATIVAREKIPIPLHLVGPDYPDPAGTIARNLGQEDIARLLGDRLHLAPSVAIVMAQLDFVGPVHERYPRHPQLTVRAGRDRREVVLVLRFRNVLRSDGLGDNHPALKKSPGLPRHQIAQLDAKTALVCLKCEPRPAPAANFDDQPGIEDIDRLAVDRLGLGGRVPEVRPLPRRKLPSVAGNPVFVARTKTGEAFEITSRDCEAPIPRGRPGIADAEFDAQRDQSRVVEPLCCHKPAADQQ